MHRVPTEHDSNSKPQIPDLNLPLKSIIEPRNKIPDWAFLQCSFQHSPDLQTHWGWLAWTWKFCRHVSDISRQNWVRKKMGMKPSCRSSPSSKRLNPYWLHHNEYLKQRLLRWQLLPNLRRENPSLCVGVQQNSLSSQKNYSDSVTNRVAVSSHYWTPFPPRRVWKCNPINPNAKGR